jgi:hypothetical protein
MSQDQSKLSKFKFNISSIKGNHFLNLIQKGEGSNMDVGSHWPGSCNSFLHYIWSILLLA